MSSEASTPLDSIPVAPAVPTAESAPEVIRGRPVSIGPAPQNFVPPQDLVELDDETIKVMAEKLHMPVDQLKLRKMKVSKDFLDKMKAGKVQFVTREADMAAMQKPAGGPQVLPFPTAGAKAPEAAPKPAAAPADAGSAPAKVTDPPATHRQILESRYAEVIRRAVLMKQTEKYPASSVLRPVQAADAVGIDNEGKQAVSAFQEEHERLTKTRGKPTKVLSSRPAGAPNILQECRAPVKLIISQHQSPGDLLMLSRAIDDLHRTYPNKFITSMRTPAHQIWENNPYQMQIADDDPEAMWLAAEYKLVNTSNRGSHHFCHGFRKDLEAKLGLPIDQTVPAGAIYLSAQEKSWFSQVYEILKKNVPYWIIDAGRKHDYTAKHWEFAKFQKLVEDTPEITWVQIGSINEGHHHPELKGPNVVDLRGKTNIRQLVRLMYHAAGVVTPVSFPMHLAAAVEMHPRYRRQSRPCVVIAGGREPAMWEAYTPHQFVHCCGALPCCTQGGCWKSRTEPIGDGDEKDTVNLCEWPVISASGQPVPKCLDMISVEEVASKVRAYLEAYDYSDEDDSKWKLRWPPEIPASIKEKIEAAKQRAASKVPAEQKPAAESASANVPEKEEKKAEAAVPATAPASAPPEPAPITEQAPESAATPEAKRE